VRAALRPARTGTSGSQSRTRTKWPGVTTSGVITEYPIPTANSGAEGIAAGPDGNLWFTEFNANKVAKVTTSGVITEYLISSSSTTGPRGIAAGSDGNLWVTEYYTNLVAKVTTSGVIT